jgi:hypothetical protein
MRWPTFNACVCDSYRPAVQIERQSERRILIDAAFHVITDQKIP